MHGELVEDMSTNKTLQRFGTLIAAYEAARASADWVVASTPIDGWDG